MNLADLGWNHDFAQAFQPHAAQGLVPARVVIQHRAAYDVVGERGELPAEVSGRFRHRAAGPSEFPTVGDWVAVEAPPRATRAVIQAVLPRRTRFSRGAAGDTTEEQVLAANIDEVFLLAALSSELNLRRIERFLALAWESGANPVLLLTKADLCADVASAVAAARAAANGAPVHAISSLTGDGIELLNPHLQRGRTIALLGPSGVGKSTLINRWCGEELLDVQEVRARDDKGRHTTTRRELIRLPSGALVIDTPGLRELQLWEGEAGIGEAFADIARLAVQCRFTDCRHETEPGCAVLRAVASGELDAARLESHRKLQREQAHFERRHDPRAQASERRRWGSVTKSLRAHYKARE